jgi:tRNA(fMet)-specific endonuclease VapC
LYQLDTNTISAWINHNQKVRAKFRSVLSSGETLSMSGVNYYEIKRGLLAVNATRKLRDFELIGQSVQMLFLDSQAVFDKAVEIHVELRRKGRPIPDADILIAATAMTEDLILVSDDSHFDWIDNLTVENWVA